MHFILLILLLIQPFKDSFQPKDPEPLHTIFQTIESETGYKFLYRDALVAGKKGEFSMNDSWQNSLSGLLQSYGLSASIDDERKRVVIYETQKSILPKRELSGYVIDSESGERLPFATVGLQAGNSMIKNTQTDINGRFIFRDVSNFTDLEIRASYVGYRPITLGFSNASSPVVTPLNIRLEPSRIEISEILVSGISSNTPADSIYRGMLDVATFSPFGESNSIRMLQSLPSVSHGASLSEGSYIRGSNSDALQVMLDGSVIYNHSHLFGLIDSFNPDVIRTGSFYYDVAPARYHAPPGGVLNLVTQTGSLNDYGGSLGLSNSVVKGSIDGPILNGRSSFMVAGRHSILNGANLFNTSDMVSWGLDIDRENSLPEDATSLNERILEAGNYSVEFYDLHGKLFFEQNENSSWTLSSYLGGDNTSQVSDRIIRAASNASRQFERANFKTDNSWGNRSANAAYYRRLGSESIIELRGGFSYLYTGYLKEDFIYQRPGTDPNQPPLFLSDFENESELNHGYLNAELESDRLTVGAALNMYNSAYLERSLNRAEFYKRSQPFMPELYGDYRLGSDQTTYKMTAGLRLQHYSDGLYTRFSPRLKALFFQNSPVSFGVSAGRNFQYLYRLSINNYTTSDIWIMALESQPPARSDHLSASISARPWNKAFVQLEGYWKRQINLRFHEITFQNIESSFDGNPWFFDNDGYSRGIEILFRQLFGKAEFTQSYTYSITELKNDRFRNGEWFYAEWDRRHRFNSIASYRITDGLQANINWTYSSGRPDQIRLSQEQQARLGNYSRIDFSVTYSAGVKSSKIKLQAGVYNLTDRNNPWYRNWVQQLDQSASSPRLTPTLVDVYDLGRQMSLTAGVYF